MSTGLTETTPTTGPKKIKRTAAKTDGRKAPRKDGRVKSTLLMPDDLDFRLTTIAASLKKDRSQLAAYLIDQGLQRYALDKALRQFTGAVVATSEDRQTGAES